MRKLKKSKNRTRKALLGAAFVLLLGGCGGNREESPMENPEERSVESTAESTAESIAESIAESLAESTAESLEENPEENPEEGKGIGGESGADAAIDFGALREENPDIFAWLYVPGTGIDCPVLQSGESDSFYEDHDAYGKENGRGAVYTELANQKNMCDFNTVLHGKGGEGPFGELYRYGDEEYFKEHEKIYLYLEGNVLTYEVFAAYEREDTSLIRTYDFTYIAGCEEFLRDLYGARDMGKQIREGWEDVTAYHFLITLTTAIPERPGKQYLVVGALTGDAAGTIDRLVLE